MAPQVQYAHTSDGLAIAFWSLGEGMPVVHMPQPITHLQLEWEFPEFRQWYERLASFGRLVRYDTRGMGLSDRDVSSFDFDDLLLDLEAVLDAAEVERCALLGFQHLGVAAIMYAVRHPERISKLVLWCAYSKASEFSASPRLQATRATIDKDWETYADTAAHLAMGWSASEEARRFAEIIRESTTPQLVLNALDLQEKTDITDLLAQIAVPTLVLQRREVPWPDLAVAKTLASRIPDARLSILEGGSFLPPIGDMESVASAIQTFVTGQPVVETVSSDHVGGLRTVLFTDIEGSTRLTQRIGDARAHELLRAHDQITRQALETHRGTEIKHTGDGFMASFPSATDGISCAIALQQQFDRHNQANPDPPLRVRVGLNAGEPVAHQGNLFGTAVQLAARICAAAQAQQILAANVVKELAAGKEFTFQDQGTTTQEDQW